MRFRALMPFIVYPTIIYFLSYFGTPLNVFSVLCVIGGMLSVSMFEYLLHRFAFHNRKIPRKVKKLVSNGHVFHHRYPQLIDNLILPLTITLPVSLILLVTFVVLFGTDYMFWFYIGEVGIYYIYEFMHFTAHHYPLNLPFFKQMREYHLSHHQSKPNSRFMITTPIWDWVFRTHR